MDSPIVKATIQSTLLGASSNTLGQLIACWQSGSPYTVELRELLIFVSYSIISCPPNYLWQTWLEAAFPGYSETSTPQEKEKFMDEKVAGRSAATNTAAAPGKAKMQLSIRNTAIKFLLDQSIGAAFNTVMFIMGIAMLRGQSWQYGWEETKTGFWPLVFAGQKLWPMVSLISLTMIPVEQRMVFGSIVGVGWSIFLTLMAGGQKHKTE